MARPQRNQPRRKPSSAQLWVAVPLIGIGEPKAMMPKAHQGPDTSRAMPPSTAARASA